MKFPWPKTLKENERVVTDWFQMVTERIVDLRYNKKQRISPMIWVGSATTTSGVATFYPTLDETSSGKALFTTIYGVIPTASLNTGIATQVPVASVKLIAADKKSITVNVIVGAAFAADGTTAYCLVIGE